LTRAFLYWHAALLGYPAFLLDSQVIHLCQETLWDPPWLGEEFIINMYASSVGHQDVLSHVLKVQEHVVTYHNRNLLVAKRNYCVTWWELLTVLKMLEYFQ
jgi:hypothetical protein